MNRRPFSDFVATMRGGEFNDEAARDLAALILRCDATGKSGTMTIKITVKPGRAGQLEFFDDTTVKGPVPSKGSTLLFGTPEGNWQHRDPRQPDLLDGLRVVESPVVQPADVRHVS